MKSCSKFRVSPLDRIAACTALIALLPVLVGAALAIHHTAGRPIIVTDEVQTSDGRVYKRYRFRTTGSSGSPYFRELSRFLRKTSIDELPELWNVVRGEMKLRDLRFRRV